MVVLLFVNKLVVDFCYGNIKVFIQITMIFIDSGPVAVPELSLPSQPIGGMAGSRPQRAMLLPC